MRTTHVTSQPPVDTSALPAETVAASRKAAQDFEAMALAEMLKPMFETTKSGSGPFGGGDGEAQFRPMLVTEMARGIAKHGGLGLAAPVYAQIIQLQQHKQERP